MAVACAHLRCFPAPAAASNAFGTPLKYSSYIRWGEAGRSRLLRRSPAAPAPAASSTSITSATGAPASSNSNEFRLRDYQLEAIEAIEQALAQGDNRQLVSLPTGSGKTVIMCHLAKRLGRRTLVLAHRTEIVMQMVGTMKAVWPDASVGILNARNRRMDAQVVVSSVQTAMREKTLKQLMEQGFEVIMVDEAHHAPAESYTSVFDNLGFKTLSNTEAPTSSTSDLNDGSGVACTDEPDEPLASTSMDREDAAVLQLASQCRLLVGFTATPERLDGKSLGVVFKKLVFQRDIQYMVGRGYLEPPVGRRIMTNEDLSDMQPTEKGDFKENVLESYVNTRQRNELAVVSYFQLAHDRQAIVFCVGVQHANNMRDVFLEAGVTCEAVHGRMSDSDRAEALHRFKTGETKVLTNCMILTEGFDQPSVSCIIMARPTKSKALYTQCIGRGLRPQPGKSDCIVIDLTDYHHNLCTTVSLGDIWIPSWSTLKAGTVANNVLPFGIGGDRTTAKVRLDALPSGDLELLRPRFGWMQFGDTGHFVLEVTEPQPAPGLEVSASEAAVAEEPSPEAPASEVPGSEAGVRWFIWLLACHPLERIRRLPGQSLRDAVSSLGSSSGDRQALVMVQLLKLDGDTYSWQVVKPGAGAPNRDKGRPKWPSSLQTALCRAEAMVIDDFKGFASKAEEQPKVSPQLGLQLSRWLHSKPAPRSWQKVDCTYRDALALAKLKGLAQDCVEGKLYIPEFLV